MGVGVVVIITKSQANRRWWEGGREQRREGIGGERDGEEREREGSSF